MQSTHETIVRFCRMSLDRVRNGGGAGKPASPPPASFSKSLVDLQQQRLDYRLSRLMSSSFFSSFTSSSSTEDTSQDATPSNSLDDGAASSEGSDDELDVEDYLYAAQVSH